ncbi:GNAT family N-acetyltransferase [Vibrio lentus]|uniref:BioF2-like acetyltransferase domain-containing protein n=1 Tax=Vibrio lentus TaxID=136468 RepID=A0A2N7JUE1_9VIBR|nr:GNAT family N-acetyltransferase [Vibrio lentus]PMM62539.1 hypothetical protein BCT49_18650 [Vibrio lentus]
MKIEELYNSLTKIKIDLGNGEQLTLFKQRGCYRTYPRMLEYFLYEMEEIFNNNGVKRETDFFERLININEKIEVYCFQNSKLFSYFPEYFENSKFKTLNLEFVTNVLEVDYRKNDDFKGYLSKLSRKRRYKFNKALSNNELELVYCDSNEDFVEFKKMHIKQWNGKGDPSILNNEDWSDFYRKGYEVGLFCIHKIVDIKSNKPIAYHLGFEKNGVFHYLMPTYDTNSSYDSPGFILLTKLIKEYSEHTEIKKFSLGAGDYSYKRWICNESRAVFRLNINKNIFKHYISRAYRLAKSFAKKTLKTKIGI